MADLKNDLFAVIVGGVFPGVLQDRDYTRLYRIDVPRQASDYGSAGCAWFALAPDITKVPNGVLPRLVEFVLVPTLHIGTLDGICGLFRSQLHQAADSLLKDPPHAAEDHAKLQPHLQAMIRPFGGGDLAVNLPITTWKENLLETHNFNVARDAVQRPEWADLEFMSRPRLQDEVLKLRKELAELKEDMRDAAIEADLNT